MKNALIVLAFAVLLAGPLWLRYEEDIRRADETLVIITPHNEATRHEFGRAFREHQLARTGRRVEIDWRTSGGTAEIARHIAAQYAASFRNHWTSTLGRPWSAGVEAAFDNPAVKPEASAARQAFLKSAVGCGMDLFFGGGAFDFAQQAGAGRLVVSGVVATHPELFNPEVIPQTLGGETFWDAEGRWIGVCLASFGICYNVDAIARLGAARPPSRWADLADPVYAGQIALADPTQSGSVAKAFEMIIQQQIAEAMAETSPGAAVRESASAPPMAAKVTGDPFSALPAGDPVAEGWERALRLLQRIAANARYFTDGASKIPFDVEAGDAAAGMCIDFYGRFQSEAARKPDGRSRLAYVTPPGGSSVSADPIGMFRGAPHPELARAFIEFVLSLDGQKLWNFQAGAPGGPERYALRRLPIRPELYRPEFAPFRSDPAVDPYEQAQSFTYHAEWTATLFRVISFVIRVMCIEPHDELREAWHALIAAGFPPEATRTLHDLTPVAHARARGPIRETLRSPRRIDHVALARELSDAFREQYERAAALAREGR